MRLALLRCAHLTGEGRDAPLAVEHRKLAPARVRRGRHHVRQCFGGRTALFERAQADHAETRIGACLRQHDADARRDERRAGARGHAGSGERAPELSGAAAESGDRESHGKSVLVT